MVDFQQSIMYLKSLTKIGRQKIVFMKGNFPEIIFYLHIHFKFLESFSP